jgi:hypothetical protein
MAAQVSWVNDYTVQTHMALANTAQEVVDSSSTKVFVRVWMMLA